MNISISHEYINFFFSIPLIVSKEILLPSATGRSPWSCSSNATLVLMPRLSQLLAGNGATIPQKHIPPPTEEQGTLTKLCRSCFKSPFPTGASGLQTLSLQRIHLSVSRPFSHSGFYREWGWNGIQTLDIWISSLSVLRSKLSLSFLLTWDFIYKICITKLFYKLYNILLLFNI